MTILQALTERYERLAAAHEMAVPGFAPSLLAFSIVLDAAGGYVTTQDERAGAGKTQRPRAWLAPAAPKRTQGVASGAFWDKTAYVFGRTRRDETLTPDKRAKVQRRTAQEHAAFRARHAALLADAGDPGCAALRAFLLQWSPGDYDALLHAADMLDQNVAFRLQGDAGFIHDRPAARAALAAEAAARDVAPQGMCLVTGRRAPIARLHPSIKGVLGAQTSGAALVSFNHEAFRSYGKDQGANAPVSEAAAFAYTTALNGLLTASGTSAAGRPVFHNRVILGDTTVVFWADEAEADALIRAMLGGNGDVAATGDAARPPDRKMTKMLRRLQGGASLRDAAPGLDPDGRVHVLGLSPNAARLSVRFWVEQSLADFTRHLQHHWQDLALDPAAQPGPPPLWRLLLEFAPRHNPDAIPAQLAGEMMRSILTGAPYPRIVLTQTILRIRADRDEEDRRTGRPLERLSDLRVALVKACLARMHRLEPTKEEAPVSLDRESTNPAYLLGRLFAVLERLQRAALGHRHATIRDRFYGVAAATPGLVFPSLIRTARSHGQSVQAKHGPALAEWFEDHIAEICAGLDSGFPKAMALEEQGRFALGYYHQRHAFGPPQDAPRPVAAPDGFAAAQLGAD